MAVPSLRNRLAAASLHLVEAAGEVFPFSKAIRDQQDTLNFARAVQGYQLSMAIGAAHELGVFGFLSEPRLSSEVALHCKMSEPAARVLLNALEACGLVSGAGARFELTATGRRHFLKKKWTYGRGATELLLGAWNHWRELSKALQLPDGHPVLRVYNPTNPLMSEYVRLTTAMLAGPSQELARKLDLSGVRRMICGTVGISFAAAMLRKNPRIELVVSCLPRLIQELPAALEQFGVKAPSEIIENSGDADEDKWGKSESYDLIFLARKFAYCGPQHGISYLEKSRRVLPSGGRVILWEPFADNYDPAPWMGATIALTDSMLGEPRPLYRKEEVAAFARQ
ncbi:MAG: hypothetical protein AB1405_15140, partial [Bdellovibrionota bacterium]